MKPLIELTRKNIWLLDSYSSQRNQDNDMGKAVWLDANENPYNHPFNRYPDPCQTLLKQSIAHAKGLDSRQIFVGNGTDEAIDVLYRCFAEPGTDNVVSISPTCGRYKVYADINNIEYRTVSLHDGFRFSPQEMLGRCDRHTKMIWFCSPNNPTGNNLDRNDIIHVIEHFDGLVVVDETYADFSNERQFANDLNRWPNLVVLHSLNAAYGCAALSVGMAYASADIIAIMDKVKYPHNVNTPSQKQATEAIKAFPDMNKWVKILLLERGRMIEAFSLLPICEAVYPTNANFFLAKMTDATAIHDYLKRQGIMVRNCTDMPLCHNCLRITVGTKSENNQLLSALRQY